MEKKEEKSVEQQVRALLMQPEITCEVALQLLVQCNYTGYKPDGRITLSDTECQETVITDDEDNVLSVLFCSGNISSFLKW